MITDNNKRQNPRVRFRNTVQYEKMLGENNFGTPTATSALDISINGLGFYTNEEFPLNSLLRVTCSVSNLEQVSFLTRVVRLQIVKNGAMKYVAGTEIKSINENDRARLNAFLASIHLFSFLDKIDLNNVMDMHFIADSPLIVKKTGELKQIGPVLDEYTIKNLMLNILDDDRYEKLMREKDVNFAFFYKNKRLRANIHFQQGKIEGVFRVINYNIGKPSDIGLPQVVEKIMETTPKGLIVVAGRTGSGKTTTLSSMVNFLNNFKKGIILSIEDPIEYIHKNNCGIIKQREVGKDTPSFSSAVRNALRQNPDVLVIGETLDKETLELVLTAAESGALVLTTIHAASTTQALDRIASFFPPDAQKHALIRLSLVLKCLLTQELIPRCVGDGLVPAIEVLVPNNAAQKIIREADWKQISSIIQTGKNHGMQTMQDAKNQLVQKGAIDIVYLNDSV
ncbi:MAG: PilT/PilU family type 4a pilus ATPase [Candidatus Omnitrophica bacterium]|nr:PilT/PilU family type 4a pilus ATPase [Candidatus Omnitrophota bacterium]